MILAALGGTLCVLGIILFAGGARLFGAALAVAGIVTVVSSKG